MNESRTAHDRAMDLAFLADRSKAAGNLDEAGRLYAQALESELAALRALDDPTPVTFAVMHRSAAWLALECDDVRLAEKLASAGLAEDPPPEIADELREVWEQANFHRHLHARGVVLADNEIQMTLSGPGVGVGITEWKGYRARVDDTLTMLTRITERRAERPFRHRGPPEAAIRNYLSPHVSLPKAASYSVSIRLGHGQLVIPGLLDLPELPEVIHDFLTIVENVNGSGEDQLEEMIPDATYRRNALALAKQIAPDGTSIKQVGFAASGVEGPRMVGFTRIRKDVRPPAIDRPPQEEAVEIHGTLLFADARSTSNEIRIVADDGEHRVKVPPEMMDDIVRPLWNSVVSVRGVRRGKSVTLTEIDPS
ncbi:hypothetical protein [Candidatus Palauibacter sp.]|uniref:hypothetical protein n=1 Tax=Candidatus Palauibacter sp. TaxID=3101350 RepID=UPI003B52822A